MCIRDRVITASHAFAGGSSAGIEGLSILTILFVGFVSLVVVFQLVPAVILFAGMLRALVSNRKGVEAEATNKH